VDGPTKLPAPFALALQKRDFTYAFTALSPSWFGHRLQPRTKERLSIPHNTPPANFDSISNRFEAKLIHKNHKRDFNGMVIYIMWNLWKELNQRIFENKSLAAEQVAERTEECLEI
jgi:hypothetical protein